MRITAAVCAIMSLAAIAACGDVPGAFDATIRPDSAVTSMDAAPSADAETTADAAPSADAETTADAAPSADAETTADAAPSADAETTADAAPSADAETSADAAPSADAETTADAAPSADAETTADAAPSADAATLDAGFPGDAVVTACGSLHALVDAGTPCPSPTIITSSAGLAAIAAQPDGCYRLGSDIDLSGVSLAPIPLFTGTFDGAGHAISHWSFTEQGNVPVALFRENDGVVENLAICALELTGGGDSTGGIAGQLYGSVINSIVSGTVSGGANVGLVVGFNEGLITDCHSAGTVFGGSGAGGLVGYHYIGAISRCSSSADVSSDSFPTGGLIGGISDGVVDRCYATGSVDGPLYVGGLTGTVGSAISNSYATGSVTGSVAGGLAGLGGIDPGTITNCYARGALGPGVAGLVAQDYNNLLTVTSSYWDVDTTMTSTSPGGGTGETTAAMMNQSTYVGWDFTNIWAISPGNYPELR